MIPTFSESFIKFVKEKCEDSSICRMIINALEMEHDAYKRALTNKHIDFITYRNDGMISFLPAGKEHIVNEDGKWSRTNRQSGKPSRIIRKIVSDHALKLLDDKEFEIFNHIYKSHFSSEDLKLELEDSNLIPGIYNMKLYQDTGTLHGSCMNGDGKFMEIYQQDMIKILCLYHYGNYKTLAGRALVWTFEYDGKNITFMDRIYTCSDWMVELFIDYAKANGWWRKQKQSFDSSKLVIDPEGNHLTLSFTVRLETEFEYYPYVDTFKFLRYGSLSNSDYDYEYELCYTNGNREEEEEDDCNCVTCYVTGEDIDEEDAIWIESGSSRYRGEYVHMDYAVLLGDRWYCIRDASYVVCDHKGTYILRDDAIWIEEQDEWYQEDDECVVWSKVHGCYKHIDDCVVLHDSDYCLEDQAVEIGDEWYHEDDVEELWDGTYAWKEDSDLVELYDGRYAMVEDTRMDNKGNYILCVEAIELQDGSYALEEDTTVDEEGNVILK